MFKKGYLTYKKKFKIYFTKCNNSLIIIILLTFKRLTVLT